MAPLFYFIILFNIHLIPRIIYPLINSNGEYGLRLKTFIAKVEDKPYYISDSSNVFEEQKQSENTLDMSSAIEVEL